ncbi:MAG: AmmeMemoRadiSam system radical SAM enzyme [Tissierellia bacterium]|nr:AmmeMemoRadiSam system radical SAM enzyme [Tissierellia bacterium]
MFKEAMYYNKLKDSKVHCVLCPHYCVVSNGDLGICNVRKNIDGELFTINFGEITSISMDPIEKKPLYFFKPGTSILSVGSFGCNLKCSFCQNYTIAQIEEFQGKSDSVNPEELVEIILNKKDSIGIAFTYNEPSIWYEYVYEVSKLLKEKNPDKDVVLITNGFINEEPLRKLLPYVDGMNIDLKGFNNLYYNKICGGRLEPVLKTIEIAGKTTHVEVTTLLVTGENDNLEEVENIAKFLASVDKNIPLHLTRYFPTYKMSNPPTDLNFMYEAKKVAEKHLDRVILGNI